MAVTVGTNKGKSPKRAARYLPGLEGVLAGVYVLMCIATVVTVARMAGCGYVFL